MKQLLLFGFLCIVSWLPASAEVLKEGLPITSANGAMKVAGYTTTGLDMQPERGSGATLQFWKVDSGVLVAAYSTTTGEIIDLMFWLPDETPKVHPDTVLEWLLSIPSPDQ
jgi:hypothetical protein